MPALDGLGFADYFIGMGEKGRASGIERQRRSAFQQFAPQVMQSSMGERRAMAAKIAQQSPEAFADLMPVIQKMDDAEIDRQKAEADQWLGAFTGAADDNDFAQRVQAARASGAPEELIPRSRGEAEFKARKAMGLKQALDTELRRRKMDIDNRRLDLMERGQYGAPMMVQTPQGLGYMQVNPQAGTARTVRMPEGVSAIPPQRSIAPELRAPAGYRYVEDASGQAALEPIPGGPADPATKPPTETQSKDIVYLQRMKDANTLLSDPRMVTGLQDEMSGVARSVLPEGLANFAVTSANQEAQVPAREWLAALLRKDTGAAITAQEFAMYGPMYIPKPGDNPQTLQRKAEARIRAEQAINAGLGPLAIVAQERMNAQRRVSPPAPPAPRPQQAPQRQMQAPPRAPAPAAPRPPAVTPANDPLGIR